MSTRLEDKPSRLSSLADAYEPTPDDAQRVLSKIQASLANGGSSSSPPSRFATVSRQGLVVGVSCLAIAFACAVGLTMTNDDPQPAPVVATVAPVSDVPQPAANPEGEGEGESAPGIPSVAVDALPTANAARAPAAVKRPVASAAATERAPTDDSLEREARLLASARRALKDGDGVRALTLLDEHATTFPAGWLASDRAAERIVVLCTLGRRDEARREAKAFLDGRPKSPLTRRVEMSCAGQP